MPSACTTYLQSKRTDLFHQGDTETRRNAIRVAALGLLTVALIGGCVAQTTAASSSPAKANSGQAAPGLDNVLNQMDAAAAQFRTAPDLDRAALLLPAVHRAFEDALHKPRHLRALVLDRIAQGATDADGRLKDLVPTSHPVSQGTFRLTFDTSAYFASTPAFYPWVSIIFAVLFRRSLGLRPRSYYRPDWQARIIMEKRSKEI